MLGGGGVDGAIHKAAGAELLAACKKLNVDQGVRCPTGQARITVAGNLAAKFVIHTVGPVYHRQNDRVAQQLYSAYISTLELALQHQCRTLALPAISCGVYNYPAHEAADIAFQACTAIQYQHIRCTFYLFDRAVYEIWCKQLRQY